MPKLPLKTLWEARSLCPLNTRSPLPLFPSNQANNLAPISTSNSIMNFQKTPSNKIKIMETSAPLAAPIAKKLKQILRAVYFMIKKGIISKRKLMLDPNLLLKRTKLIGKAIANVLTFNVDHNNTSAAFSSSFMDPNASFYNQRDVEFSCSNTPSYPSFHLNKQKNRKNESAAAAIARAFEMLSNTENFSDAESVMPSPSPALMSKGTTPCRMRQLRVTDSPFPILKGDEVVDGRVDKEAEEFIKRFYQQLKIQQRDITMTPEYAFHR